MGNFRSGRHRRSPSVPEGKPIRPKGLSKQEAWAWKTLIEPAKHLGANDTALAWECCEAWGLYRQAVERAKGDPTGTEIRIAVASYAENFIRCLRRLRLDPLGRRATGERPDDNNQLVEFGIVR